MDDETVTEDVEHMDIDGNATPLHNGRSKKDYGISQSTAGSSSKSNSNRETRGTSVDMLGGPQADSNPVDKSESPSNVTAMSIPTDGTADSVSTDPSSTSTTGTDKDLPSIDQQVATIMQHASVDMKDGDIGYAISVSWLNRVLARSSDRESHGPYEKDALEGDVGPIDNSSILLRG